LKPFSYLKYISLIKKIAQASWGMNHGSFGISFIFSSLFHRAAEAAKASFARTELN
jgi:hypothetical protein